ncbi:MULTISPECIES: ribbon-helix-helix domain-containing protein [Rhodococcus]|uniref:ribbon-helix-helix domain-containing protein n=1 Tax=Rhodococcus TaxID=1827 RepID=UPI0034DB6B23
MTAAQTRKRVLAKHIRPNRRLNPGIDTPAVSPRRTVRLPDVLDAELEALSNETGLTVSKIIRQAVNNYVTEARSRKAS